MQAHRQLDEHDPHILRHRQQHFAQALQLAAGVLAVLVQFADGVELADAIHQAGDGEAEGILEPIALEASGRHRFVQQRGGDHFVIHAQIGQ